MRISKGLIWVAVVFATGAGSACSPKAEDQAAKSAETLDKAASETREAAETAADDTKNVAEKVGDKTREIAGKTVDKTKEIAGDIADKSKDVVSSTDEKITDGWITTKVSAKFVDESLLKGSDINVDTKDRVVTLKGTVGSDAAKARAVKIARDSEGVARVVDQLSVKAK